MTRKCFFSPKNTHQWVFLSLFWKVPREIFSLIDRQLNRARLITIITYFLFSIQSLNFQEGLDMRLTQSQSFVWSNVIKASLLNYLYISLVFFPISSVSLSYTRTNYFSRQDNWIKPQRELNKQIYFITEVEWKTCDPYTRKLWSNEQLVYATFIYNYFKLSYAQRSPTTQNSRNYCLQ